MSFFQKNQAESTPSVSAQRRKELAVFEKKARIRFKNKELLNLAFSHRSYVNEYDKSISNNEKLEFLGDSVLGLVVSEYLYRELFGRQEGDLAKIKSFVVSENSLARVASELHVDTYLLIGKGEEMSGGRKKKALLADAMEAIIGAFFLDSGFKLCRDFVLRCILPEIRRVMEDRHDKDYKTLLQELIQKKYKSYPKYVLTKKSGPDHDQTFWIEVHVEGKVFGPGRGKNKKEAEQVAASEAYKVLAKMIS